MALHHLPLTLSSFFLCDPSLNVIRVSLSGHISAGDTARPETPDLSFEPYASILLEEA